MIFEEIEISGCYLIKPTVQKDNRGAFIKTWNRNIFLKHHLDLNFNEEYYSISNKNVLRGMHFQEHPQAHHKLIYCISGKVFDVILDIRKNSPTFGKTFSITLSGKIDEAKCILIAPGVAHGFYAHENNSILIYKTTTVYSPEHDKGIHWQSILNWPTKNPIVSDRDTRHPALNDYIL